MRTAYRLDRHGWRHQFCWNEDKEASFLKFRYQVVYAIEKQPAGFRVVFSGHIDLGEMRRWVNDSQTALIGAPASFGLLIDMRTLLPLSPEVQRILSFGQHLYQRHGQRRSVVVVERAATRELYERLARESGVYQWERYISAETTPDWEMRGWSWIDFGLDPANPHADGLYPCSSPM
jgi:hypothetical protein